MFKVSQVLSEIKPVMFKLVDLLNDQVQGTFYREQLTKTSSPAKHEYFLVEKILGRKKINGQQHVLVKYLYYPNKFNQYILEKNLVIGQ